MMLMAAALSVNALYAGGLRRCLRQKQETNFNIMSSPVQDVRNVCKVKVRKSGMHSVVATRTYSFVLSERFYHCH